MYLGRNPYRMLHLVNIWTALICSQAQDCALCKAQSSRIYLKVGKGLCKVSIPVVLAMHVFLEVIYARIRMSTDNVVIKVVDSRPGHSSIVG